MKPSVIPKTISKSCEDERGGFARNSRYCQNNSGQDTSRSGGNNNSQNHLPLGNTQRQGGFSNADWNQLYKFFSISQNQRNENNRKRDGTGESTEMSHWKNHQCISENTNDNRRNPVYHVRAITDQKSKFIVSKFRKINRTQNS